MISLDLRKAFDRVKFGPFGKAIREALAEALPHFLTGAGAIPSHLRYICLAAKLRNATGGLSKAIHWDQCFVQLLLLG